MEMAFAPISFLVDAAAELECPEEENLPAEDLLTDIEFSNKYDTSPPQRNNAIHSCTVPVRREGKRGIAQGVS